MAAAPVVRPMGIDKLGREGIGRCGVEVKRINVRVDATAGVQALSGAHVAEGDPIGIDPDAQETVRSPISGIVEFITFDSDTHTLIVTIRSNCRKLSLKR